MISQAFLDPVGKPPQQRRCPVRRGDNNLTRVLADELLDDCLGHLLGRHDRLFELRAVLDQVLDQGCLNPEGVDDTALISFLSLAIQAV